MIKQSIVKLKDLCTTITDGSHYSPKGVKKGIPMLSVKDMRNNGFDYTECKQISREEYENLCKNSCHPEKNDILIAKDGSYLKEIFVVKEEREEAILSSIGILKPNLKLVDPYYIKYYLSSDFVKEQVAKKYVSGSALPRIILKNFANIEIPYIDIEKQRKIVNILKTIDDKIENNNRIILEIESMAKTIYDYWFLQYEFPNEEGKPYKSSGGKMVYNEELKKEVPEGWTCKKIGDIEGNIVTGKTPSTKDEKNFGGTIPFITIDDIRQGLYISNTIRTLSEKGANLQVKKYIPEDSICVTCIATVGLVGITTQDSQTNQQINSIVCENKNNLYYLVNAIKDHFKYSSGAKTGNVFDNMNKEDFSSIKVVHPTENVLKMYKDKMQPLYDNIKSNILENQELTKLRDYLLPLLMNGQVSFKN